MKRLSINRRTFVKGLSAVAAMGVLGTGEMVGADLAIADDASFPAPLRGKPIEAKIDPETGKVEVNKDVLVRYSMCLGCYNVCGSRVKVDRNSGRILTIGGNPYHPSSCYSYLNFDTPLEDAYKTFGYAAGEGNTVRATLCGRGQATQDSYAHADRITTPLKRAGKRGEGKWQAIGWDQLIEEVVEGGKLFADLGEDQEVVGFRGLHDTVTPMDPTQPDLGPISNQLVQLGGRADGRTVFGSRFVNAYGSVNTYGHGSSCGGPQAMREFTENGGALLCQSDVENAEYILWMGTFPGANGRNFQSIAKRASQLLRKGAKMDVLDPVLGGGIVTPSAQNIKWVPIRADADVEFSLAVIRWMMENGRVNTTFVSYPNYQAAYAAGYASYTNATHLVIVDPANANYLKLLSAADAGLETPASVTDATKCDVVIDAATGQPAVYLNSTAAQLEYEGEVNGIKVRTGYLFLKDNVNEHTMDEYSQMCGVPIAEIERIADEFTSHGVKSSARGIGSTVVVNGIGATQAFRTLNALIGANQMVGGLLPFRNTFKTMGDAPRYKLATIAGSPKLTAQAISRTNKLFQKTKEYENRVAAGEKNPQPKLPWFSSATNSDNQAIVSVVNQYPYQAKILFTWMNNAIQAAPGALRDEVIDRLKDTSIVPLHVACDCFFGEQTQLADYIVPDTTPFESFAVATQEGYWYGKGDGVRWPVKDQETIELADGRHASFEAFVVDVAKACDVPGFGDNAIEAADGTKWPLNDACDFFLKGVANLAFDGESPVADISAEDIDLQGLDALPAAWKASVSAEEWPKVQNVLSRGGRFLPIEKAYSADGTRSAFAKEYQCLIYSQPKAVKKNPYSGDRTSGCLRVEPQMFADNSKMTERYSEEEYPLRQCCHKPHFRSVSMQSNSPIMRDLCSTNYIELNIDDAAAAGVADGDKVRLAMPDGCAVAGEAMVRAGIARGSFGIGFGYGHRAYGTQDETVDGATTKGIAAIGAGTPVMAQLDPTVSDGLYFLADNDTGCPARNGGMFRVEKA